MLTIEIAIIVFVIILQIIAFSMARIRMKELRKFFPSDPAMIDIVEYVLPRRILKDSSAFQNFIQKIKKGGSTELSENETGEVVEVIAVDDLVTVKHPKFIEVIQSTNSYLCKNKGAAADFNILQDICERHIQRLDNNIGNLINVPLYVGLAGTFVGIIAGLNGIDFKDGSGLIDADSINDLLIGVMVAMTASLLGLIFTVFNTALTYKNSVDQNDEGKNLYYDFMQRELLPVLNVGMAGSLSSFKGVLNNFISKFGENISEYHDTAKLLNDNLGKQHLVLEEINKLSLTKTATTIASSFINLKNASDEIDQFFNYQKELNKNILEAKNVVEGLNLTMGKYQNFNHNLEVISDNVNTSIEFQKQFKESLEVHFPTIDDHREVWRGHVDEVNLDIKSVYKELTKYFQTSTQSIQQFVDKNEGSFSTQNDIQAGMKIFVENSNIQNKQFKMMNKQIESMRKDFGDAQNASLDLNKDLVKVIKGLAEKLSKLEIHTSKK